MTTTTPSIGPEPSFTNAPHAAERVKKWRESAHTLSHLGKFVDPHPGRLGAHVSLACVVRRLGAAGKGFCFKTDTGNNNTMGTTCWRQRRFVADAIVAECLNRKISPFGQAKKRNAKVALYCARGGAPPSRTYARAHAHTNAENGQEGRGKDDNACSWRTKAHYFTQIPTAQSTSSRPKIPYAASVHGRGLHQTEYQTNPLAFSGAGEPACAKNKSWQTQLRTRTLSTTQTHRQRTHTCKDPSRTQPQTKSKNKIGTQRFGSRREAFRTGLGTSWRASGKLLAGRAGHLGSSFALEGNCQAQNVILRNEQFTAAIRYSPVAHAVVIGT